MKQFAFLDFDGRRYVARGRPRALPHRTAAVDLIQGIFRDHPDRARAMLRRRIYLNYEPTEVCLEMIRVAAKRWKKTDGDVSFSKKTEDVVFIRGLSRDAAAVGRAGKNVTARLLSRRGRVLAETANTNFSNRTLHAEINLVQEFVARAKKKIPRGAVIEVSLKPCRMCAAMIVRCAEDPSSLKVVYAENDPGRHARLTALERFPGVLEFQP